MPRAPRPAGPGAFPQDRPPPRRWLDRTDRPDRAESGLNVIAQDPDLIIVDKPAGLLTAAVPGSDAPSLFGLVKQHIRAGLVPGVERRRRARGGEAGEDGPGRRPAPPVGVIHRLDREASGLLVFSLSERGFDWLKNDLKAKRIHRLYLAVVEGEMGKAGDQGTIQSFLAESRDGRVVSTDSAEVARASVGRSRDGGSLGDEDAAGAALRPAVTHYRIVAVGNGRTVVQVRLETGRKHQIRVHLAGKGFPILGDDRYGARTSPLGRVCLHAAELGISHPADGQSRRYFSPAPDEFYRLAGAVPPPRPTVVAPPPPARSTAGRASDTAWEDVAGWYDDLIDEKRNDHYAQVIIPGTLRLVAPTPGENVLDVACGQGVMSRALADLGCTVTGVDAAPSLIQAAQRRTTDNTRYLVGDATKLDQLDLAPEFDAAVCVMALANIEPLGPCLSGIASLLKPGGRLVWVVTHPAFRGHGQTSWGWDPQTKVQYRRVDGYLSNGFKAISMHPGSAPSVTTLSFHRPLQYYMQHLAEAGLAITSLEEWPAQRVSEPGPRADAENRARREIPLFLAVRCLKLPSA
ncbi:MAG: methyltransferase domain-containing protein [Phycisphaerales bacterium]|nr:methyltransferase domain-containing protein [Phycisphaerales bacterium]